MYWAHWQCIVAIGWSYFLLRITCGMATLFHNCSLLGFVPLEALEGLSTQRVWHSPSQAEIQTESSVWGGPMLFITKLMMTYAAFTRYFMRPFPKLQGNMRLIPNMRFIMKAKLTTPPKPRCLFVCMTEESSRRDCRYCIVEIRQRWSRWVKSWNLGTTTTLSLNSLV